MSKHQECEECKCDFIGPDRNVGDNLCEDCYVERHNPCLFAIEQLKEQLGTKQDEIERLEAIVSKTEQWASYLHSCAMSGELPLTRKDFDDHQAAAEAAKE